MILSLSRLARAAGLAATTALAGVVVCADQSQATPPAPAPNVSQIVNTEMLAGAWDYNDEESVDAATGRPEQAPRSATQRRGAPVGAGGAGAAGGRGGGAPTPAGGFGGGGNTRGFGGGGMNPMMLSGVRGLVRDLVEVAEALTIKVSPEAVTITDDLERERTYPTNGRKQKYQLGAAVYQASTRWEGAQLHKNIEGDFGFKMTEVYFLSDDAKRLFVIIRLGDQKQKNLPLIGANRIYDRIAQ